MGCSGFRGVKSDLTLLGARDLTLPPPACGFAGHFPLSLAGHPSIWRGFRVLLGAPSSYFIPTEAVQVLSCSVGVSWGCTCHFCLSRRTLTYRLFCVPCASSVVISQPLESPGPLRMHAVIDLTMIFPRLLWGALMQLSDEGKSFYSPF